MVINEKLFKKKKRKQINTSMDRQSFKTRNHLRHSPNFSFNIRLLSDPKRIKERKSKYNANTLPLFKKLKILPLDS